MHTHRERPSKRASRILIEASNYKRYGAIVEVEPIQTINTVDAVSLQYNNGSYICFNILEMLLNGKLIRIRFMGI